jgi:3-hydroxyisobutyrate dehydrogenase
VIGQGIASNLRKKLPSCITLHINDISEAVCEDFVSGYSGYGKIVIEQTPRELASSCRTVLSSLPSGDSVRKVFLGENGIIGTSKDDDRLIIECSTIDIEDTKEIGATIIEGGVGTFVDATVSGGAWGAREGQLTFMVGHESKDDPVGRRLLETLSLAGIPEKIRFCGALGMGQVAKIAHNYTCLVNLLSATEGMALGMKYGIDKTILWQCMTDGAANSWIMGLEQPVPGIVAEAPSSKSYERAFAARLSLKDLGIANNAAKRVGLDPTGGEAAYRAFEKVHNDPRTTVSARSS